MRPSRRDELVQKALQVFYRNGFHATGMDQLVRETGISKTSMYKYFQTKDDLILACLHVRDVQFRHWFANRVEALEPRREHQLGVIFDVLDEWFSSPDFKGCMFIKAAAEFQEPDHPAHMISARHKCLMVDYIQDLAHQAGLVRTRALAGQLGLLIEGAIIMARFGNAAQAVKDARTAAKILSAAHENDGS